MPGTPPSPRSARPAGDERGDRRPGGTPDDRVSVVVIVYDDATRVVGAVRSALGQGDVVGEVVVVDDASTDGTPEALGVLAGNPRVRVIRREVNSGGCGTPRNEGLAAARERYVMFLDSDDVLPPGAVRRLLEAVRGHAADVAAGVVLRRELPSGQEVAWQADIFPRPGGAPLVVDGIADHPEFLRDTLSVNKVYDRCFLDKRGIRFPEGAVHYEDFVFTGRLYAARPRLVAVPDTVYIWHVRRDTGRQSISLRRDELRNWRDRVDAHAQVVTALEQAGEKRLALAALTKFVDYDLPLYLRELRHRPAGYRTGWWRVTRRYLGGFDPAAVAAAQPAARWAAGVILEAEEPVEVARLAELAADPPRLPPPYRTAPDAEGRERPVFGRAAEVPLEGLVDLPLDRLPVAVDGRATVGRVCGVDLYVHDPYGRLADARPVSVALELRSRTARPVSVRRPARLIRQGEGWRATVRVDSRELRHHIGGMVSWTVRARLVCGDGSEVVTAVRSPAGWARRAVVPGVPDVLHLVQAYTTNNGELALRAANGAAGVAQVLGGRVRRLVARLLR